MFQKIFLFCVLNCIYLGSSSSVPYITRCKASDSDCLKTSSQAALEMFVNGIPELGVERLDPVSLKHPVDASTSGLNLVMKDIVVTGMKTCSIDGMRRDPAKSKLYAKILCDRVVTDGQYEMDGKLLIIQVSGKGKIRTILKKMLLSVEADLGEKKGKDGKKYWDVKRFTHTYELHDKAELEFENLFTGNDVLGRAAAEVIDSSSNDIVIEIGPPVVRAMVTKVVENIKRFFNNVPPEDLALD